MVIRPIMIMNVKLRKDNPLNQGLKPPETLLSSTCTIILRKDNPFKQEVKPILASMKKMGNGGYFSLILAYD